MFSTSFEHIFNNVDNNLNQHGNHCVHTNEDYSPKSLLKGLYMYSDNGSAL